MGRRPNTGRTKLKEMEEFSPESRQYMFMEKVRGAMWDNLNSWAFKKKVKELADYCLVPYPEGDWWVRIKPANTRPKEQEDMFWNGTLGVVSNVHSYRRFVNVEGERRAGFFKCLREFDFPKGTYVFLGEKKNDVYELLGEYRNGKRVK